MTQDAELLAKVREAIRHLPTSTAAEEAIRIVRETDAERRFILMERLVAESKERLAWADRLRAQHDKDYADDALFEKYDAWRKGHAE